MDNNPVDARKAAAIALAAVLFVVMGCYIVFIIIPVVVILVTLYVILDLMRHIPLAVIALLALRPINPIEVIFWFMLLAVLNHFSYRQPQIIDLHQDQRDGPNPNTRQRRLIEDGLRRSDRNVDIAPGRQEDETGGEQESESFGAQERQNDRPDSEHEYGADDQSADE